MTTVRIWPGAVGAFLSMKGLLPQKPASSPPPGQQLSGTNLQRIWSLAGSLGLLSTYSERARGPKVTFGEPRTSTHLCEFCGSDEPHSAICLQAAGTKPGQAPRGRLSTQRGQKDGHARSHSDCASATRRRSLVPTEGPAGLTDNVVPRETNDPSHEVPQGERAVRSQATATVGNTLPGSNPLLKEKGQRNSWAHATLKTQVPSEN